MLLFPAIDLKDNRCVRLTQGDYSQQIIYSDDPVAMALEWERQGAKFLHLVDLDGARGDYSVNNETIRKITQALSIPVQLGGGIRSVERARELLALGVNRLILGTAVVENRELLHQLLAEFGSEQIVVSVDALDGYVALHGWEVVSDVLALTLCQELEEIGVETIVYTDIAKDGMLSGPNFEIYQELQEQTNLQIIASGGISQLSDLTRLDGYGLYGCIIGKALYDGRFTLAEALRAVRRVRIIPC